jgi:hypothetical protein
VHFISHFRTSTKIRYDRLRRDFRLSCIPPCEAISHFHRPMLRPYSVSAEAIERGHAKVAECLPMAEPEPARASLNGGDVV